VGVAAKWQHPQLGGGHDDGQDRGAGQRRHLPRQHVSRDLNSHARSLLARAPDRTRSVSRWIQVEERRVARVGEDATEERIASSLHSCLLPRCAGIPKVGPTVPGDLPRARRPPSGRRRTPATRSTGRGPAAGWGGVAWHAHAASARARRSCPRSLPGHGAHRAGPRISAGRGNAAPRPDGVCLSPSVRAGDRRPRPSCPCVSAGSVPRLSAPAESSARGQGRARGSRAGPSPARRNPGGQAVSHLWGEESHRTACIRLTSQR
jgi:hypothetical protein